MLPPVDGEVVDIFAGAGGWEVGAREVGIDPLGVELDDAACATRDAAGLRTLRGDVAALDPGAFAPVVGLIGSPPCPTFSSAGSGFGHLLTAIIVRCLRDLMRGRDSRASAREEARVILEPVTWDAEFAASQRAGRPPDREKALRTARRQADMSLLVVEPLRWALELRPEWIALEQVPDVLGLWRATAELLRDIGYATWTGVLEAERYGVPQTRERAFLMADRRGPVHPPAPTHQRYEAGVPASASEDLFGGSLLPWVSMDEALGWGMTARPSVTVSATSEAGGGPRPLDGGGHARAIVEGERVAGRWKSVTNTGNTKGGTRPEGLTRSSDEPAPTVTSRADQLEKRAYDSRGQRDGRTGAPNRVRGVGEPAPTIAGESRNDSWWTRRPATTVSGDPRIADPDLTHERRTCKINPATGKPYRQQDGAVRVTIREAAVLQSFPEDFPWQGTRTAQFQQVGNAVPPRLARHVLSALRG